MTPETDTSLEESRAYADSFARLTGVPYTEGNRIDVLRNGDEIFPALLDAIESAEVYINFLTFVYWKGDIAQRFAEALSQKARDGIRVRALLDAYGSHSMDDKLIELMKDAGVDVRLFRKPNLRFWDLDKRTHRKLLICDGKIAFTGGVGIAGEWEGDARNPDEWRETHFAFRGPSVDMLDGSFAANWLQTTDGFDLSAYNETPQHREHPTLEKSDGERVQVISSSPATHYSPIDTVLYAILHHAKKSLRITTPYFTLDDSLYQALVEKLDHGLRLEIILPGKHIDRRFEAAMSDRHLPGLIEHGAKIWRYQKTMIHTKAYLLDGVAACVGSPNLNLRSRKKDEEVAVMIFGDATYRQLDAHFDEDLKHSELLSADQIEQRGLLSKITGWVLTPFREQM